MTAVHGSAGHDHTAEHAGDVQTQLSVAGAEAAAGSRPLGRSALHKIQRLPLCTQLHLTSTFITSAGRGDAVRVLANSPQQDLCQQQPPISAQAASVGLCCTDHEACPAPSGHDVTVITTAGKGTTSKHWQLAPATLSLAVRLHLAQAASAHSGVHCTGHAGANNRVWRLTPAGLPPAAAPAPGTGSQCCRLCSGAPLPEDSALMPPPAPAPGSAC